MAYRIISNKTNYGEVRILFTSNDSIVIGGNSTVSNVALSGEIINNATVTQMWFGSPSGNAAYWELKSGSNTIFVADSTAYLDFRGNGMSIPLYPGANLSANLFGSTIGALIVELKKQS